MLINILVCTTILWILQNLLIVPLSAYFSNMHLSKLELPAYSSGEISIERLPSSEKTTVEKTLTNYYIAFNIIVLGTIGLLVGVFFGFYFIGISFDKYGWPGMISLILFSILGSSI